MTDEQQGKAWNGLPERTKELARNLYRTSHIPQYEAVLELLFGESNLIAPSEPNPKFNVGDKVVTMEDEEKGQKCGTITSPVKADIDDTCYEALRLELAKAVAIAYAEKDCYEPAEIAAQAVEVANGVVERLKESRR